MGRCVCWVDAAPFIGWGLRATGCCCTNVPPPPPCPPSSAIGLQVIRCSHLAANEAVLRQALPAFAAAAAGAASLRCCAVLDGGPLVRGELQSLLVVLPAATPADVSQPGGSDGDGGVVRALALSSSTAVCPPGKSLLYLWAADNGGGSGTADAASGTCRATEVLLPALAALTDTTGLRPMVPGDTSGDTVAEAAVGAASDVAADVAASGEPTDEGSSGSGRPTVAWAAFYTQASSGCCSSGGSSAPPPPPLLLLPPNVALCPGPDATATFASAVQVAKQCYARLYPPPPRGPSGAAAAAAAFPLDPQQQQQQPHAADDKEPEGAATAAGGQPPAGAGGGGGGYDSDEETVAALQAALRQATAGGDGAATAELPLLEDD